MLAMANVGDVWAPGDPRAALDFVRAHPDAPWRDWWLEQIVAALAATDRPAAEAAAELASRSRKEVIRSKVLKSWAGAHPEEVGIDDARAAAAGAKENFYAYSGTLWGATEAWTSHDPRGAGAWAAGLEEEKTRNHALQCVGATWAPNDPQAVLDWSVTLSSELREPLLLGAAPALTAADPDLAIRLVSTMKSPNFDGVGAEWAKRDPDRALAWAQTLRPGEERDQCILAVLESWAERDPAAARAKVGAIADEKTRAEALSSIEEVRVSVARTALRKRLLDREEGK